MQIDHIEVNFSGEAISGNEAVLYVQQFKNNNPGKCIRRIDMQIGADFVDGKIEFAAVPFERIRRITGYLVGTTARWNNAKRAEERDRVKHGS